jgi:hypothetical protein
MSQKTIVDLPVIVKKWDASSSKPGKVRVESWDKSERTKRAIKTWAGGWGLAVASVFLPGAHFILVPTFLIATPFVAYFVSKQNSVILGGESVCPYCDKPFKIEKGPQKWPLEDVCTFCQNHVIIERA